MKSKITKSLSAVAASSFMVGSASAALVSYDGGTGNWDKTTANWNSGTATFADGDDVTFNGASGTATVTEGVAPGSITYSSSNNLRFLDGGGVITGTGGLVKNGTGTMTFGNSGTSMANTFSGGTIINAGTLRLDRADISNPLGTGDVSLNGGSLYLWRSNMANTLNANGGSIISSNGFGNTWNGEIILNSDLDFGMHFNMNVNGVISGAGGLNVNPQFGNSNTLSLNAVNTYTGATNVTARLSINGTSLSDSGALLVSGTGIVNLTNTETVGSLSLDGVNQTAPGTYGALGSGADNESAFFAGSGFVELAIPEPSSSALLALGGLALIVRRRK